MTILVLIFCFYIAREDKGKLTNKGLCGIFIVKKLPSIHFYAIEPGTPLIYLVGENEK
jgi:hypothetical protein